MFNCQVPLCTRTLNHVAVDNPRFQKQGYGRMLQSERGEGVEWIALKFKKKKHFMNGLVQSEHQ